MPEMSAIRFLKVKFSKSYSPASANDQTGYIAKEIFIVLKRMKIMHNSSARDD